MDRACLKLFIRLRGDIPAGVITTAKGLRQVTLHDSTGRKQHSYDFHRIFVSATPQQEVFEAAVRPLLENVKEGYDACFLAYGPAHSGKTYTVFGGDGTVDSGMLLRSAEFFLTEAARVSGTKTVRLTLSLLELYGDTLRDLGLGYTDLHAADVFPSQNLDVAEVNGRICVEGATEVEIHSLTQVQELVQKGMELRATYESRSGSYSSKAHTVVVFNVSQSLKKADWDSTNVSSFFLLDLAGSDKSKSKQGKEYYESLNASSSFHALSNVCSSLGAASVSHNDHKLTRLLEPAMSSNSTISLLTTINPSIKFYEETLASLSYTDRCKPAYGVDSGRLNTDGVSGSDVELKIKMLQDERAELKEKLRNIETAQDEQLKAISDMLGLETDPESIISAAPGSKSLQKLNAQKEAVQKIDVLVKRNKELEKKIEDSRLVFDKIKRIEYTNQENHIRRVLELKDELTKLKDQLQETKAHAKFTQQEHIEAKTEELHRMLAHSQYLVEEKTAIVNNLPESMKILDTLEPDLDMRELGKQQIENEYSKRFREQQNNHAKQIQEIHLKYKQIIQEKDKTLSSMVDTFKNTRIARKQEISALCTEMTGVFKIIQQQKCVLDHIKQGKYNQNLRPVYVPQELIPEFPDSSTFPQLFGTLNESRPSSHPVKKLQVELTGTQSKEGSCHPAVTRDISALSQDEAKKTLHTLREIHKTLEKEYKECEDSLGGLSEQKTVLEAQIHSVREERDRYRELYTKEVNSKRETRSVIENQRRMIEKNIGIYQEKSPNLVSRPSTQGKWNNK